jgi:hypothetical protein
MVLGVDVEITSELETQEIERAELRGVDLENVKQKFDINIEH